MSNSFREYSHYIRTKGCCDARGVGSGSQGPQGPQGPQGAPGGGSGGSSGFNTTPIIINQSDLEEGTNDYFIEENDCRVYMKGETITGNTPINQTLPNLPYTRIVYNIIETLDEEYFIIAGEQFESVPEGFCNTVCFYEIATNTPTFPIPENGQFWLQSNALALDPTGNYLIIFSTKNGQSPVYSDNSYNAVGVYDISNQILRPLANGGIVYSGWNIFSDVAVLGNTIFFSGNFSQTGDGSVNSLGNIVKYTVDDYDTSSGTWSALPENGLNGQVWTMKYVSFDENDYLYVGGEFDRTGTGATKVNRFCSYNITDDTWNQIFMNENDEIGLNNAVAGLLYIPSTNDLWVGGNFSASGENNDNTSNSTTALKQLFKYNISNGSITQIPYYRESNYSTIPLWYNSSENYVYVSAPETFVVGGVKLNASMYMYDLNNNYSVVEYTNGGFNRQDYGSNSSVWTQCIYQNNNYKLVGLNRLPCTTVDKTVSLTSAVAYLTTDYVNIKYNNNGSTSTKYLAILSESDNAKMIYTYGNTALVIPTKNTVHTYFYF